MRIDRGLVIGYGSIGRYHARLLSSRYGTLGIVDSNTEALQRATSELPDAILGRSLADLGSDWSWDRTLAVIATWGTGHARDFDALADYGVKHVLCEKPLAHSVVAADRMIRRAQAAGVVLGVHMQRRYSGLAEALRKLAERSRVGEARAVVIHGGAKCLVTNGIHFIDLASDLFGEGPSRVVSNAVGHAINPRSPSLRFYGGTAVWTFSRERQATFTMLNESSVAATVLVYYRDALLELRSDDDVVLRARRTQDVRSDPRVTRTGPVTDVLFEGRLPEVLVGDEPTRRLLDELEAGTVRRLPPAAALQSLGACIGAIAAGQSGCAVALPIALDSDLGRAEWPIS